MATETTATMDDASIEALRTDFHGEVLRPGEPGYDARRRVFNGMIDKRPALIARCTGTADVLSAVRFARERELLVAVRGGGHSVAGFSSCDGGIVIDLSSMRGVRVDPSAKTARAQGGATWGDYDRETQVYGLASPGGLVSTTGVGGLTLGGGLGFLSFKYGLACDSLIGADVVTADGRVVVVNDRENSDLLWGLRGGGGNFGIVTSFEFKLHPVSELLMAIVLFRPEEAFELLRYYRRFVDEAPTDLIAFVSFMTVPAEPSMPIFPPELLGKRVVGILAGWPGPVDEGEKALAPLRAFGTPQFELVMPLPYTMVQSIQDEDMPWGSHSYWKSAYTTDAPDELLAVVAERASTSPSDSTQVAFGRFGGAIAKVSEDESAFPLRDAGWVVQMDSNWSDPKATGENVSWARETYDAVRPFALERAYVNFFGDEGADRVAGAYGETTFTRLQKLKTTYDPTNFFRLNQNIPPA